jgi:mono/diheme cytochrome c family protein
VRTALALLAAGLIALGVRAMARPPFPQPVRARAADVPATAVERGRAVYAGYGCSLCHGVDGKGGFANPNAETDGKVPGVVFVAEGYTRSELRRLLQNGTPQVGRADQNGPRPPYRMPGWSGQMREDEVADLVEYLFGLYPTSAEQKWR